MVRYVAPTFLEKVRIVLSNFVIESSLKSKLRETKMRHRKIGNVKASYHLRKKNFSEYKEL